MTRLMPSFSVVACFAVGLAACDNTGLSNPDSAGMPDISVTVVDLAKPVDLASDMAVMVDFIMPPDLADLAGLDLQKEGPPPTVISHSEWVGFCQSFTACGIYSSATNLSICTGRNPQPGFLSFAPPSILACIKNAGADCAKIKTCLANNNMAYSCDADAGVQASCANDVYTICLNVSTKLSVDCAKQGFTCVASPPNMPNAALSGCGFGSCDLDGGVSSCVAGFTATCNNGHRLYATEDCRVFSTETCAVSDGGVAACVGTGAACTADRCNGTTLVKCKAGKETSFDCNNEGLTCVLDANQVGSCGLGNACDSTKYLETCNGSMLTYCDFGVVKSVDCVMLGWKRCVPRAAGAGGYCSAS